VITGFNTDIEFDGVVYHVQTEDKGLDTPLILSLVYVGGAILASKRSAYHDLINAGFDPLVLAERLQRQHTLLCAAIKAGRIEDLAGEVKIDAAYGGSCTGGKMADMEMYAAVLREAVERGQRVAPGVRLYLQFGSQKIKQYARERGYLEIFARAGAELIDPSCGACINAGPGASTSAEQVTISAQNRNFPGRSGPGKVYLASPYVVAASAIAGRIISPEEFLRTGDEELVGV
jgi:3-isopropylmalate/(R)-2-methylmalate dehydratase large subunit